MPTKIGRVDRDHDLVTQARRNLMVAAGAAVGLDCLVRLDVTHLIGVVGHQCPSAAHNTMAMMTTNAAETMTMSLRRLTRARNGLKPTALP
jgi:hypothetical protein